MMTRLLIRDKELVKEILQVDNRADESPMASAIVTFVAFLAFGIVPLLASILFSSLLSPFMSSTIGTLATLFALGWFKSQWTMQKPMVSGCQMAGLGGTSSFIAYAVASLLSAVASGVDV